MSTNGKPDIEIVIGANKVKTKSQVEKDLRKILDEINKEQYFSNETRGLSFLSFCGIEIFGKMAIVVRYELINPVRQKRDICLRSVNGAKSKMAKQSPVEIIAIVRPGII